MPFPFLLEHSSWVALRRGKPRLYTSPEIIFAIASNNGGNEAVTLRGMTHPFAPTIRATPVERLVGERKGQGYIRLELGGMIVLEIGLIAPGADGFGGGGGQDGVSA